MAIMARLLQFLTWKQAQNVVGDSQVALTATGTNQATAYPIVSALSVFGTVAAGTGAVLPSSQITPADTLQVCNLGANPLLLYPPPGGTINGGAVNASLSVAVNTRIDVQCVDNAGLTFLSMGGTSGGGAVTQIIAGTNVTVSPAGGTGAVTVNSVGTVGPAGPQGVPVFLEAEAADDPLVIPGPQGQQGAPGAQGVPGVATFPVPDDPDDPLMVPGPQGPQGIQGATGPAGPPAVALILPDDPDEPLHIPGPQGPQGVQGNIGGTGPQGAPGTAFVLPEDPDDPLMVPGPQGIQGLTGAQGPVGPPVFLEAEPGEDAMLVPGVPGPAGPAGGLIAFAGGKTTALTIASTTTPTSGGITLANQTANTAAVWRVKFIATVTAANSATARNIQVAPFWGSTTFPTMVVSVATSAALTTGSLIGEFVLTGSSTTAVFASGYFQFQQTSGGQYVSFKSYAPASTTVTAGLQTIDLRFSFSVVVAGDSFSIHQVTIERLI